MDKKTIILYVVLFLFGFLLAYLIFNSNGHSTEINSLNKKADSLNLNIIKLEKKINTNAIIYDDLKQDIIVIKDSIKILKNEQTKISKKYKSMYNTVNLLDDDSAIQFFTDHIK